MDTVITANIRILETIGQIILMASSLEIMDNTESKCSQEGKIDTDNSFYIIYFLSYFLNIHQSILPFYFVFLCVLIIKYSQYGNYGSYGSYTSTDNYGYRRPDSHRKLLRKRLLV